MIRAIRGVVALMILTVGAAGCTRQTPPAPAVPTVALGDAVAVIQLPLDDYLLSHVESMAVSQATSELIRGCMRAFGVDMPVRPIGATSSPSSIHDRRYGLLHPQSSRVFGYRPPVTGPPPADPARSLDANAKAILGGQVSRANGHRVPEGGCAGAARRALFGEQAVNDLAQQLSMESFTISMREPRVIAIFRRWAQCMNRAGFHHADPITVASDPAFGTGTVSQTEIATALTDINCKTEVNLPGVWNEVESAIQRDQIVEHRPALEQIRQSNLDLVAKSHNVLNGD